ncbi:hypothetical protein H6F51_06430 [Cyanobacteria bacterium FACHB-DQ100]|uniref:hypothetical protein n=1 Tax=Leptolyngbya sp. DQ-M1 TaxID=2933920 RepID=UPI0019A59BEC|nr:hypothetical protein [Cyanobacteria bacterium FACHB-DQ100]
MNKLGLVISSVLILLPGCFPSVRATTEGQITFNSSSPEPLSTEVFNNDLGIGKTDSRIVVELTVDKSLLWSGDQFRTVIISGSDTNCFARDYIRGKLISEVRGYCNFPSGSFKEVVNGRKTGKTIKVNFDPIVLKGEKERANREILTR